MHKQSYRAMTAGLKIVKLDESSIEQAAQLEKQVFKMPSSVDELREFSSGDNLFAFAIYLDDKYVGHVTGYITKHGVNIYNLVVIPEYRGKGIGNKLMEYLETYTKEELENAILLHVRESNVRAQKLYKSRGFEVYGKIPGFYGDEDAISMRKIVE